MRDDEIIALFFARDEAALRETERKYGGSLLRLAQSITENPEDAEECVNDTYADVWKRIPPTRPQYFLAYLAKITRHICYGLCDRRNAQKRNGITAELDEMLDTADANGAYDPVREYESAELGHCIDSFLRELGGNERMVFLRRYFWSDSISFIAGFTGFTEAKIKSMLHRTRKKLRAYLESHGFEI